jgi:hypothetical protein
MPTDESRAQRDLDARTTDAAAAGWVFDSGSFAARQWHSNPDRVAEIHSSSLPYLLDRIDKFDESEPSLVESLQQGLRAGA